MEPQQRLAGAAELGHLVEHQPDRLLHAPIRILLQPVADLDEADRGGDHHLFIELTEVYQSLQRMKK